MRILKRVRRCIHPLNYFLFQHMSYLIIIISPLSLLIIENIKLIRKIKFIKKQIHHLMNLFSLAYINVVPHCNFALKFPRGLPLLDHPSFFLSRNLQVRQYQSIYLPLLLEVGGFDALPLTQLLHST